MESYGHGQGKNGHKITKLARYIAISLSLLPVRSCTGDITFFSLRVKARIALPKLIERNIVLPFRHYMGIDNTESVSQKIKLL